jgi:hypothetical protein
VLASMLGGCETTPGEVAETRAPLPFEKRTERYLPGLDETVTVVKGLGGGYVLREDGRVDSLANVLEANAAAWIAQHGKVTPEIVAYSTTVAPTTEVEVAFLFEPDIDWEEYFDAQASGNEEWEAEQAELLHDAIAATSETIVASLLEAGVDPEDVRAAEWSPFVHATLPLSVLETVADLPEVTRIIGDATVEPEEQANNVVTNPATWHGVGNLPAGLDGSSFRVSVLEPGPCLVRGDHILINDAVTYSHAGLSCSSDAQCGLDYCDGKPSVEPTARCINGKCHDGHATGVASVLMRFLPQANLYVPNGGRRPAGPVCNSQITTSYDFLRGKFARWVNESYGCTDAVGSLSPTDGAVQDYYSRVHNFFITKSAENDGPQSMASPSTWNSVVVGGVDNERELSCFSSTDNPYVGTNSYVDREEPDVVAYAGQVSPSFQCQGPSEVDSVRVADPASTIATDDVVGTSFAAPAVLGIAALVQEYCSTLGKSWNSVEHRAVIRTAATTNVDGWAYSTLPEGNSQQVDHKDGAGLVFADFAIRFCDNPAPGGNENWGVTGELLKPASDGQTSGLPNAAPEYPNTPPGEAQTQDQQLNPGGQTGYRWKDLWDGVPMTLQPGARVRATFSWEACVTTASPTAARTLTDYDLFLYNRTLDEGLYASQTDDDVNEGFDVIIPAGWGGDYDLILVWPDGSNGCGGTDRTALAWYVTT